MPSTVIEPDGTIDMRFSDEPVCECCNETMEKCDVKLKADQAWEGFLWPTGTTYVCLQCDRGVVNEKQQHVTYL